MTFLANENFPNPSIRILRSAGFKVFSISEENAGFSDNEVLNKAIQNQQIILTFDKDYGQLIFRDHASNPPAVIFFRYKGTNPSFAGQILIDLLKMETTNFENHFTVIEEFGIRQRKY